MDTSANDSHIKRKKERGLQINTQTRGTGEKVDKFVNLS